MDSYTLALIAIAMTYLATFLAKRTDLKSIEEPPLTAYAVLLITTAIIYPVYSSNPALAVVNALSVGVFSVIVNIVSIVYRYPVIGAYDLVFLYLEGFSLPPIPVDGFYVPTMLVHTAISIAVAVYKLKVGKEDFVRFFEIHEGVARYLFFAYAIVTLLYLFSTG